MKPYNHFTQDQKKEYVDKYHQLKAAQPDVGVYTLAKQLGVGSSTLRHWLRKDPTQPKQEAVAITRKKCILITGDFKITEVEL
jgi:phage antirepressor YoqD-like protein